MVMPETSSNYTCIVENEAGAANYTYNINVLSRPHILDIDGSLTNEIPQNVSINNAHEIVVARGEPVDINCLADGNPQPDVILVYLFCRSVPVENNSELFQITWKRNNITIANSNRLFIEFASLSDGGMYVCEATNIVGTDSLRYKVEVHCKLALLLFVVRGSSKLNEIQAIKLNIGNLADRLSIYRMVTCSSLRDLSQIMHASVYASCIFYIFSIPFDGVRKGLRFRI